MTYNPKQLIIDLDGVICPIKDGNTAYRDLQPYKDVVDQLVKWKSRGFSIIIHSARTMRTHEGDLSRINKHTAQQAVEWLEHWGIPYDGILFGKPWPGREGYYIDDRAIRPREFLTCTQEEIDALIMRDHANLGPFVEPPATNIVITMAGLGQRFQQAGYTQPKYQIEVRGKSLFEWALISLQRFIERDGHCFFLVRRADKARDFITSKCVELGVRRVTIIELDALTNGQATTALQARSYWWPAKPLLIYNIDTHVSPDILRPEGAAGEGWIPCFQPEGEHWSFAAVDAKGNVIEVREKQRISPYATIGLYWFSSASLYEYAYNTHYSNSDNMERGECYVAPLYNVLINKGMRITSNVIPISAVHPLGTPDEVESFRLNSI